MKKILIIVSVLIGVAPMTYAQELESSLWIADDVNKQIYEISLDGLDVHTYWTTVKTPSNIDLDLNDGTLIYTNEYSSKLFRYDTSGNLLGKTLIQEFAAKPPSVVSEKPEGVAFDPFYPGTSWVVNDPVDPLIADRICHITNEGVTIKCFPTAIFDLDLRSQQTVAVHPGNATLFVNGNKEDSIYNITRDGELINIIYKDQFDPDATNLQGISVDPSGKLWVTDRDSGRIYQLTSEGDLIRSFESAAINLPLTAAISVNPIGIAFDPKYVTTEMGSVIRGLQALLDALPSKPSVSVENDRDLIVEAIQYIDMSLNTSLWLNKSEPTPLGGNQVYDLGFKAVELLMMVENGTGITDVSNAKSRLENIYYSFADAAIESVILPIAAIESATTEMDVCKPRGHKGKHHKGKHHKGKHHKSKYHKSKYHKGKHHKGKYHKGKHHKHHKAKGRHNDCKQANRLVEARSLLEEAMRQLAAGEEEQVNEQSDSAIGKYGQAWSLVIELKKMLNESNSVPEAYDGHYVTKVDQSLLIQLSGGDDGDRLYYVLQNGEGTTLNGAINCNSETGWCLYRPNPGFTGKDQFEFLVHDGINESGIALVDIIVTP